MKNLIILALICFGLQQAYGQNLDVYVKLGSVELEGNKHTAGNILHLKPNQDLLVHPGAICILKNETNIKELPPGRKYTFDELQKTLQSSKSFSKYFIQTITTNQIIQNKNPGITMRGNPSDPYEFSPADSTIILSDSIRLSLGHPPLSLNSPIRLYKIGAADTLFLQNNGLEYHIETPNEPGSYIWNYHLKLGSITGLATNLFIVPDEKQRSIYLSDLNSYTESIAPFSNDLKTILLNEYYSLKKIYPTYPKP
jgi:hypothetical protein